MKDMGTRISMLWIVVMFNMVFADILTFITPGALQELWAGQAGPRPSLRGFCWGSRSSSEIPIAMIFAVAPPEAEGQPLGEHRGGGGHHRVRHRRWVADSTLRVLRGRADRMHGADRLVRLGAAQPSAGMGT